MYDRLRRRLYSVLEESLPADRLGRWVKACLMALILANVAALVLETEETVAKVWATEFRVLELVSIIVFTVEYVLRLWVCVENPQFAAGPGGRLRYALQLLALVDLLVILPFYLPLQVWLDLRFLRTFRILRLLVLLRLGRFSQSLKLVALVVHQTRLRLWATATVVAMLILVASVLMYMVEHEAQPKVFPSVPAAMWWAVVTMTTVGYGDAYPVTVGGKMLASLIAFLGIGLFALPAGILASGFADALKDREGSDNRGGGGGSSGCGAGKAGEGAGAEGGGRTCPHCGKCIDPRH